MPGHRPTPLAELKKPVDFGPVANATKATRKTAIEKWTDWWNKRDLEKSPDHRNSSSLRSGFGSPDAIKLADAILTATPDRRDDLVIKYRDTKGVAYTEALAAAIVQSPSASRAELRKALADRMVRMTEATLRDYLDDPLSEIRRAAALGLAKRGSVAHVEKLADLLADADPLVRLAAHSALCQLTTVDMGPTVDASEDERADAILKWQKWWKAKKGG